MARALIGVSWFVAAAERYRDQLRGRCLPVS